MGVQPPKGIMQRKKTTKHRVIKSTVGATRYNVIKKKRNTKNMFKFHEQVHTVVVH